MIIYVVSMIIYVVSMIIYVVSMIIYVACVWSCRNHSTKITNFPDPILLFHRICLNFASHLLRCCIT